MRREKWWRFALGDVWSCVPRGPGATAEWLTYPLVGAGCCCGCFAIANRVACLGPNETLICLGWKILVVPISQPGTPDQDKKEGLFVPGLAIGTKGAASATWLAHPFVPVGVTNRDKRTLFFCFPFLNSFSISIVLLHFN